MDKKQSAQEFQTPKYIAEYMISLLPKNVKTVAEPTPGEGNISSLLIEKGFIVNAPVDYFLMEKNQRFDAIVMNPPFSVQYANMENANIDYTKHGFQLGFHILKECMDMSDIVIALMPWVTIINSDIRRNYLMHYGLKSITALPRQVFPTARVQTAILELVKGYSSHTIFKSYSR